MWEKAKLSIETEEGLLEIDGWAHRSERWNGWSIVIMNKNNADKIVQAVKEVARDEGEDAYFDTDEPEMRWPGQYLEEVNEKVYAVGSGYWTWTHRFVEEGA